MAPVARGMMWMDDHTYMLLWDKDQVFLMAWKALHTHVLAVSRPTSSLHSDRKSVV